MPIFVGIKVGQRRERSAICAAERASRKTASRSEIHFKVRYLERLPAGATFPQVADRAAEVLSGIHSRSQAKIETYTDATGLGEPIIDLLGTRTGHRIRPVYFNHGDRIDKKWNQVHLGKAYLVARLQLLLQTDRLHLPQNDQAHLLAQELLDYEIQVDPAANDRYGAFSVGKTDDLVTALGLAAHDDSYNCCYSGWSMPGGKRL